MGDTNTLSRTKELIELGTFEMISGVARISDPCYDKKTWCAGTIKNVMNGTWKAQVIKKVETYTYNSKEEWCKGKEFTDHRNILIAVHETFDKTKHFTKAIAKFHGGMDAGMAGIFDDKMYKKDYKEDYLLVGNVEYNQQQDEYEFTRNLQRDPIFYKEQLARPDLEEGMKELYAEMLEHAKNRVFKPYSYETETTRDWYSICCDKSLSNVGAGVIRNGVVSSSGYGDGGFDTVMRLDSKGKVVGIKLVF